MTDFLGQGQVAMIAGDQCFPPKSPYDTQGICSKDGWSVKWVFSFHMTIGGLFGPQCYKDVVVVVI
jgi:hypothetical protein